MCQGDNSQDARERAVLVYYLISLMGLLHRFLFSFYVAGRLLDFLARITRLKNTGNGLGSTIFRTFGRHLAALTDKDPTARIEKRRRGRRGLSQHH